MDAVSTEMSPVASTSPPLSPFMRFQQAPLPPIKTLPTWNRPKFNVKKNIRSIPKNQKLKIHLVGSIGHNENFTQTTPPNSSSKAKESPLRSPVKTPAELNRDAIKQSYEKKIVFLQSNHAEVLSKLHQELERMKNENKTLQFQVIMAGGSTGKHGFPIVEHNEKRKKASQEEMIDPVKVGFMQDEINALKKSLNDSKLRNNQLIKLLEEQRERSESALVHSNMENKTKTTLAGFNHQKHFSHNSDRQEPNDDIDIDHGIGNIAIGSYEGTIKELKHLTNTQKNQLIHLKEKLQDQNIREKGTTLPKLKQRSARSTSKSATMNRLNSFNHTIQEPLSLPILQPFPANRNLSLRQKPAQALHIQRQRSNRDVSLLLDL